MTTPFETFGPFVFDKRLIVDPIHCKDIWKTIDIQYPHLADAKGVYLLSVKNGQNHTPLYVGITERQGFRKEVFNNANVRKILSIMPGKNGALCVHLLAKPKQHHKGYSTRISENTLKWLEKTLLWCCCYRKGADMLNKSYRRALKEVEIKGITGQPKKGRPNTATANFMNAIGL